MNEILKAADTIANDTKTPNKMRNWASDIYKKVEAKEQVQVKDLQILRAYLNGFDAFYAQNGCCCAIEEMVSCNSDFSLCSPGYLIKIHG